LRDKWYREELGVCSNIVGQTLFGYLENKNQLVEINVLTGTKMKAYDIDFKPVKIVHHSIMVAMLEHNKGFHYLKKGTSDQF
jgi:hypothetical protein